MTPYKKINKSPTLYEWICYYKYHSEQNFNYFFIDNPGKEDVIRCQLEIGMDYGMSEPIFWKMRVK